jgi:phosphoglycerol transferase MdoB-like AlkP superfamily enzyme
MERTPISVASVLCISGAVLNLLVSVIRLGRSFWFLTFISGVGIITVCVFMRWNPSRNRLWGGIIFLYSNLGMVPFGLSYEGLLPWGFAAFIVSLVGAMLILSK